MKSTLELLQEAYEKTKDVNIKMAIEEIILLNHLLENMRIELRYTQLELTAILK